MNAKGKMALIMAIVVLGVTAMIWYGVSSDNRRTEEAKQAVRTAVKDAALEMASSTISGLEAEQKYTGIDKMLLQNSLTYGNVGLEHSTLEYHVQLAYERDARMTLQQLRDRKAEPDGAKADSDKFLRERERSKRTFAEFSTSTTELTRIISRNALEFIVKNGGRPTPVDYRSAGLPVPTIVRTRTVVRRVPTPAPQSARRAPARPATRTATRPRT